MTILIDKAVGSKELIDYFPLSEIGRKSNLGCGDIAFTGNGPDGTLSIAIEIKSLSDFIDSVRTGRLHGRQTRLMLQTYDVNYLLIYGIYRCELPDTPLDPYTGRLVYWDGEEWIPYQYTPNSEPLQYSMLESCIFSAEAIGMRVRPFHYSHLKKDIHVTRQCIAIWIYCLYSWWQDEWTAHKSIRTFDQSRKVVRTIADMQTMGLSDDQLRVANIAKEFPGVSYERAIAIARTFNSPAEFASAITSGNIANIVTTSGKGRKVKIGPVIADRISSAWNGKKG